MFWLIEVLIVYFLLCPDDLRNSRALGHVLFGAKVTFRGYFNMKVSFQFEVNFTKVNDVILTSITVFL